MKNDDLTDVCDRLQDHTRAIEKLVKAVTAKDAPPVVNVTVPPPAAPQVRVEAPVIHAPVTIEQPGRVKWKMEFERDLNGYIKSPIILTPT